MTEFSTDIVAARARYERAIEATNRVRIAQAIPHETLREEREAAQALVSAVSNWHKLRAAKAIRSLHFDLENALSDAQLSIGVDFAIERALDREDS